MVDFEFGGAHGKAGQEGLEGGDPFDRCHRDIMVEDIVAERGGDRIPIHPVPGGAKIANDGDGGGIGHAEFS